MGVILLGYSMTDLSPVAILPRLRLILNNMLANSVTLKMQCHPFRTHYRAWQRTMVSLFQGTHQLNRPCGNVSSPVANKTSSYRWLRRFFEVQWTFTSATLRYSQEQIQPKFRNRIKSAFWPQNSYF